MKQRKVRDPVVIRVARQHIPSHVLNNCCIRVDDMQAKNIMKLPVNKFPAPGVLRRKGTAAPASDLEKKR